MPQFKLHFKSATYPCRNLIQFWYYQNCIKIVSKHFVSNCIKSYGNGTHFFASKNDKVQFDTPENCIKLYQNYFLIQFDIAILILICRVQFDTPQTLYQIVSNIYCNYLLIIAILDKFNLIHVKNLYQIVSKLLCQTVSKVIL